MPWPWKKSRRRIDQEASAASSNQHPLIDNESNSQFRPEKARSSLIRSWFQRSTCGAKSMQGMSAELTPLSLPRKSQKVHLSARSNVLCPGSCIARRPCLASVWNPRHAHGSRPALRRSRPRYCHRLTWFQASCAFWTYGHPKRTETVLRAAPKEVNVVEAFEDYSQKSRIFFNEGAVVCASCECLEI